MSLVEFKWIAPLGWSRPSARLVAPVLWVIVFRTRVFVFKMCLEGARPNEGGRNGILFGGLLRLRLLLLFVL